MLGTDVDGVSFSFLQLQRVQRSFEDIGSFGPMQERTILRMVRGLGATVIPLCVRVLGAEDADDRRVRWACSLLSHLAEADAHRARVVQVLQDLVSGADASSPVRLRAQALLGELGCGGPGGEGQGESEDQDTTGLSVREISTLLGTAPEIARAADRLVAALDGQGMLALVDALGAKEPRRAIPLLDELLLRSDVDEHLRRELKRIRAPLRDRYARSTSAPVSGRQPVATATFGRHASGQRIVVVSRRALRSKTRRYRALYLSIAADGTLADGMYREDFALGEVEKTVLGPLRIQGYQLEAMRGPDATSLVIRAARTTRQLGRVLPRAFYLGRDLVGIYDEHTAGVAADDDLEMLLDRARDLLAADQPERARPLFERYVAQVPDNPDGCAGLAMCLLALGDDSGARPYLRRAAWLDPHNPNHHWNLAAIAHRQHRLGGCYLALIDYLTLCGEFDKAPGDISQRRATARTFVAEYERIARVEYPGTDPASVAHADELLFRARQRMSAGQCEEAVCILEQALVAAPAHYPSLTALGVAHGECNRVDQARDCLRRALQLRPGFSEALQALVRLDRLTSMPPRRARTQKRRSSKRKSGVEKGRLQ